MEGEKEETESVSNKKVYKKNKKKSSSAPEDLEKLSREELLEKVLQLEAHNNQLKDLLQKKNLADFEPDCRPSNPKKFDFSKVAKRHVLLKFYYLGWDYQGYVTQEDTYNTIEFNLFRALEQCCLIENRESSNYNRCGRTDKGVSSFSQVISIDLRSKLVEPNAQNAQEEMPYCAMLNRLLPRNIRCYAWTHVDPEVSARFNCSSRIYRYYFPKGDVDVAAMQEGAKHLEGTHDFRNFCKMDVGNGVTDFTRNIQSIEIQAVPSSSAENSGYQMLQLTVEGGGFLWHQIRSIMSILFLVGQHKESPDVVNELLDIEKHPSKPQYSLANQLPLNLFKTKFDSLSLSWNSDDKDVMETIKVLQSQWTEYTVKSTMVKEMIDELQALMKDSKVVDTQVHVLQDGVKSRVYKPLMTRMKCDTLESKIEYYLKRRKLTVADGSNNDGVELT